MNDGYYIARDADTFGPLEYCAGPELTNALDVELTTRDQVTYRGVPHVVLHVVNGRLWVSGRAWSTPTGKVRFTSADRMRETDHSRIMQEARRAFQLSRVV